MLLGMDEYPYHQITDTFAAVAGSDPQWNDGHYVCVGRRRRPGLPSRRTSGSTRTTTCSTASSASATTAGSTTSACPAGCDRTWTISASVRCGIEVVEPMETCGWCSSPTTTGIALDVVCRTTTVPYMDPIEITPGRRPADERAGDLRGDRACARGGSSVGDDRVELRPSSVVVLPQPLLGLPGRPRRPTTVGAPLGRRPAGARASGSGCCSTCPTTAGSSSRTPSAARRRGTGMILLPDRAVPIVEQVAPRSALLRGRPAACRAAASRSSTPRGQHGRTRSRTSAGCTARAAATSAGSTTGSGKASTAATTTSEGEVWDVSHPTQIVEADGTDASSSTTTGPRASPACVPATQTGPGPLRVRRHPPPQETA